MLLKHWSKKKKKTICTNVHKTCRKHYEKTVRFQLGVLYSIQYRVYKPFRKFPEAAGARV